ncbi:MAG: LamG domain-containing protein [Phycisphaeraceae bacterium]|nr:LamG domain-containing protein [Phycisphaeraceae bacterium]
MSHRLRRALIVSLSAMIHAMTVHAGGFALKFFGAGPDGVDRVKIPLEPDGPVNVGGDFTIEFRLKAPPGVNTGVVRTGLDGWITGNILIDRDVYYAGDHGDYGLSLGGGRLAFGLAVGGEGQTIVGATDLADRLWRHVAITREEETGRMCLYVDGKLDAEGIGPPGDASYRVGRPTDWPNSDPFLVLGAEKHDAGPEYPSFHGLLDDLRISDTVRYTEPFTPPANPAEADDHTVLLLRFDEGEGDIAHDSSPHTRHGQLMIGGPHQGPRWSSDTPWSMSPATQPATTTPPAGAAR